jgi:hypothetical protein
MSAREAFPDGRVRARERYLSALSSLVSGGLTVDEEQPHLGPELALLRTAGVLLKAVTLASYSASDEVAASGDGWTPDSAEMTQDETIIALSGITALLTDGGHVLAELRSSGDFRSSGGRIENIEANQERAARLAGELALEREAANDGSAES